MPWTLLSTEIADSPSAARHGSWRTIRARPSEPPEAEPTSGSRPSMIFEMAQKRAAPGKAC
jgi:hypothetical protein